MCRLELQNPLPVNVKESSFHFLFSVLFSSFLFSKEGGVAKPGDKNLILVTM